MQRADPVGLHHETAPAVPVWTISRYAGQTCRAAFVLFGGSWSGV